MRKLRTWWRWEGKHIPRNIRCGIRNLIKWFPVIWKDRDWDQHFIYEILAKKLTSQADYIEQRDWHTRAKRDAEVMRLVVKLIRIMQEDTYTMEYMEYNESKYNFTATDDTEQWYTMDEEVISENYDEFFAKYPRQYKLLMQGKLNTRGRDVSELDAATKALMLSHHNQDRAHKLLFKIMEQNIEGWWD